MSQYNSGAGSDSGRSDYDRPDTGGNAGDIGAKMDANLDDCGCEPSGTQFANVDTSRRREGYTGSTGSRSRIARDAADDLQAHAAAAGERATHAAHEVARDVGAVAREATDAARELKGKAAQLADRERSRAADVVDILADAVRDAGRRLLEEPRTRELGIWGDIAADKVHAASSYLREHDAASLFGAASRIARRNPELFLGIMATAGLAMARFIKATERRPEPHPDNTMGTDPSAYGGGYGYGQGGQAGTQTAWSNTWSGAENDVTGEGRPLRSDYPQNVGSRDAESSPPSVVNTTDESELPIDPTPSSKSGPARLTEEGV